MQSVYVARVSGPLAPFADGFRAELDRLGYTPASREYKVNQVAGLSRWLEAEGLGVVDVSSATVEAFLGVFVANRRRPVTLKAMRPLLEWLRSQGVIATEAAAVERSAVDELLDDYRCWLTAERALAARTIDRYGKAARRFLAWRVAAGAGAVGTEGLDGEAVTGYLLAEVARGLGPGSLQGRVAELRSLLRFFYLRGVTDVHLADAVPPVPGWKERSVPVRLDPAEVRALLDSCDRSTPTGVRDVAMLLVLARLGLRAAELAGLRLEDLDWRAGELVVHGKGGRDDRMPLPVDVGEALAAYLRHGRPRSAQRVVFLTVAAPPRPMWPTSVSQMVWRQSRRAGMKPIRAHRLRHALASELVGLGVRLPEIAQVLRQRDLATTAVYAKIDHRALRELALPWPETVR
jgi:integrase/recombinase XerD